MRFEKMSTRITLQRWEDVLDERSGALTQRVALSSIVWAEARPTKGGSVAQDAPGGGTIPGMKSFIIRYRDGINPLFWRVKDKDNYLWNIVDVPKEIGRKQGLELICQWMGKRYIEGVGIVDVTSMLLGGAAGG